MKDGLNITWVGIRFPDDAFNFNAFVESHLQKKLEENGFLIPGYHLLGDSAYMMSKLPNGPKDEMNIFHCQLHTIIECTLGVWVNGWGIIKKQ